MQKRLTKSKSNVVLTGTLAGIAEYFNIDPTIVRIVYVFISLMGMGSPVLLYLLLAIIIPSSDKTNDSYGHNNHYSRTQRNYEKSRSSQRKEAEKVDDDNWSDF